MKTYAPLQLNTLAKTVLFVFLGLTILWGVSNYVFTRQVYLHWVLLLINAALAAGLGWLYYKSYRHTVFSYDQAGFEIEVGRRKHSGEWKDYSQVSLFHRGQGSFAVRLYKGEEAAVEIPASALRLDASTLRLELIGLVRGKPRSEA